MIFTKEEMMLTGAGLIASNKECSDGKCSTCQMMTLCATDQDFIDVWKRVLKRAVSHGSYKALSILYVNAVLLGAAMAEARMMNQVFDVESKMKKL